MERRISNPAEDMAYVTKAVQEIDASYRYYCILARYHGNRHRFTMAIVTVSMVGAVAFMVSSLPEIFAIASGLFAAFVSIIFPLLDDSRRATSAATIAVLLMDVVDEAEMLWQKARQGEVDSGRAAIRAKELYPRMTKITMLAALQHGLYAPKVNKDAATDARKYREKQAHA